MELFFLGILYSIIVKDKVVIVILDWKKILVESSCYYWVVFLMLVAVDFDKTLLIVMYVGGELLKIKKFGLERRGHECEDHYNWNYPKYSCFHFFQNYKF